VTVDHAAPPFRLGRYEVRAKIADGGMAAVYVAHRIGGGAAPAQSRPGELVAIKMVREELARTKEFRTMFLDEARIAARLVHPNIVRYHELGDDGGHAYIVMELLLGQSLFGVWDACRARGVRLRYDMIAWIGARVADGLHYAHELKDERGTPLDIVHRDVNATNIFVTYDGTIKIIDFGLAKAANRASKTAAGIIKGKVAYMSPEQAVGAPVDRRTDVFALGTTLWELACDRRLFKHADEVETLKRVHAAEVPNPLELVDGFPPALWRVLERALARDKERRYATAGALARDLDAFVAGAVDPGVVAAVMQELFGADRARQERWIAEASRCDRPRALEPLKPPSSFRAAADHDDAPPAPAAPAGAPPPAGLAPAPVAPAAAPASRPPIALTLVVAIVLAAIVVAALALR
jgi:serine/threonine protein kinase